MCYLYWSRVIVCLNGLFILRKGFYIHHLTVLFRLWCGLTAWMDDLSPCSACGNRNVNLTFSKCASFMCAVYFSKSPVSVFYSYEEEKANIFFSRQFILMRWYQTLITPSSSASCVRLSAYSFTCPHKPASCSVFRVFFFTHSLWCCLHARSVFL